MARLITGGTGFVGAELARILVGRGEDVVIFDRTIKRHRIDDIEKKVKLVQGDLSNYSAVFNVVKNHKVTHIYHVGSMLNFASQDNPWAAFQANIIGTYNVLEAARLLDVQQLMFTSSIGVFKMELGAEMSDTTIQRPTTFYGVGKLWGEGMVRFYRSKFNMDCRCIRYPAVCGPGDRTPGHWWVPIIESPANGLPGECYVSDDIKLPLLFFKDAARAADMVLQSPKENVKMVNYNVAGDTNFTSARQVEAAVKKILPGAVVTYKPDPAVVANFKANASITRFDDSPARREWGWKPKYVTAESIVATYLEEMKAHPGRYA